MQDKPDLPLEGTDPPSPDPRYDWEDLEAKERS
jgi:hypothetical protein